MKVGDEFYVYSDITKNVSKYKVTEVLPNSNVKLEHNGEVLRDAYNIQNYEYGSIPEEAKAKWITTKLQAHQREIDSYKKKIKEILDSIEEDKQEIDYDSLKENHPDLFI